jgi:hypothetical protein
MIITGTVKSITESSSFVYITIEAEDRAEIRLTFRADDERVHTFRFRAQMTVDLSPAAERNAIGLTKAA